MTPDPVGAARSLDRPRLGERYRRGTPVVLVVAPAGFGKSTILQSWRAEADVAGSVSLAGGRNGMEAGLVLLDLAAQVGVSSARRLAPLLAADGVHLGDEFVAALADELRRLPERFTVFIDDLHAVGPTIGNEIGRIASATADETRRIVLATRRPPPWPTARWRISGFAEQLGGAELAFTEDEVAAVLGPQHCASVSAVLSATRGWPAAVEAVRWRLTNDPETTVDVAALDVVDYVGAEILPELPPSTMRVLTRTSILTRFPLAVARAVAEDVRAEVRLRELALQTSLISVDGSGGTFECHPLLRETLRRRLASTEPGSEIHRHALAADAWMEQPDSFDTALHAIEHLIAARRWTEAINQINATWEQAWNGSRLDLIIRWLDAIPGKYWRDDPGLVLLSGWSAQDVGDWAGARRTLKSPGLARTPAGAAVGDAVLALGTSWTTNPTAALALVKRATAQLDALPADAQFPNLAGYGDAGGVQWVLLFARAKAHAMSGNFGDALQAFAALIATPSLGTAVEMHARAFTAWTHAMRGETADAQLNASVALAIAAECDMTNHFFVAPAHLALATTAALRGDRPSAATHHEDARRRATPVRALNFVQLGGIVQVLTGDDLALESDQADRPALALVEQFITAITARRLAASGAHDRAETLLRTTTVNELTLNAWVDVLSGAYDRAQLQAWVAARPQPTCPHGRVVRALSEASTAIDPHAAFAAAIQAAEIASSHNIRGVLQAAPTSLWAREHLVSAHPALTEAAAALAEHHSGGSTSFTPKELELLRMLQRPDRVRDLADRLFVSTSTIKWHKANIYRKLGVARRRDAIARATELGLLDP